MGGVGSMMRPGRTLYIGGLSYGAREVNEAEEVLSRHFCEWGPLEFVNYKPKFGCAFVRYKFRASAEFAKVCLRLRVFDVSVLHESARYPSLVLVLILALFSILLFHVFIYLLWLL